MEGTPLVIGFYPGSQLPSIDERYMNDRIPYADVAEVLSVLDFDSRAPYLTVNIDGVDYWFLPDEALVTLVPKLEYLAIANKAITLLKMADVASPSVFYRKTPGVGTPEVQSLNTLREDLNIEPKNANIQAHIADTTTNPHNVTKSQVGLSSVDNTSDADKPISNAVAEALNGKQDNLTFTPENKNNKVTSISTASTDIQYPSAKLLFDSLSELKNNTFKPYRIILPAASTVAGRCITPTEIPEGWTVSEGSSDQDLLITHTLNTRKVIDIKVWISTIEGERLMLGPLAYVGIIFPTSTTIVIESLCTKEFPIRVEILFN